MKEDLKVTFNVPAVMRDGTILYSNIFQPAGEGHYPVALSRTPYGKDYITSFPQVDVVQFAKSGYIVVIQDVRGRGKSQGEWSPFTNEIEDGFDSVEWAAELPGSTGAVGMWGFSYLASAQWAAAELQPPHLKAIIPAFSCHDTRNGMFWRSGAFELGLTVNWLVQSLGMDTLVKRFSSASELSDVIQLFINEVDRTPKDGYYDLPLNNMEWIKTTGLDLSLYARLMSSPNSPIFSDKPYSFLNSNSNIPSLHVSGWHDIFLQGTIDNFINQETSQSPLEKKSRLIIGPWSHLNYSNVIGDMDYGLKAGMSFINGKYDYTTLHTLWFDQWLKDQKSFNTDQSPIEVFMTGLNVWREEKTWPPEKIEYQPYYLGYCNTLKTTPCDTLSSDVYQYDPANPTPVLGGNLLMSAIYQPGVKDQRDLYSRKDIICYLSEELNEPLTLLGPVQAILWIASSAPETDFVVRLVDIHPDGFAENITDGITRTSQLSLSNKNKFEKNKVFELSVDLWSVGHVFKAGHKIQVDISSSSFPRWDRNLNTGEQFGSGKKFQVAKQTIFHGEKHLSRIILPIING